MYIAEPDPSVNKNGSVHEWERIDTEVRSCESNRYPAERSARRSGMCSESSGMRLDLRGKDKDALAYSFFDQAPSLFLDAALGGLNDEQLNPLL